MSNRRAKVISVLLSALLLSACASRTPPAADTTNLNDLRGLNAKDANSKTKGMSTIRQQALQDTALSVGAQGGLAFRAKQLNGMLDKKDNEMDRIFNFNAMLLEHNVLPPVLSQADHELNLDNDRTIRLADKTYRIMSQARFVTTVPTWRDYLWLNYKAPAVPDATLLPRNGKEQSYWDQYVHQGWDQGVQQANDIYQENLSRLKQDYNGMVLYRKLLSQHMVSKPYVAQSDLGLTGDGDEIHINDTVLRITALPQLQTDTDSWKPVVAK